MSRGSRIDIRRTLHLNDVGTSVKVMVDVGRGERRTLRKRSWRVDLLDLGIRRLWMSMGTFLGFRRLYRISFLIWSKSQTMARRRRFRRTRLLSFVET